MSSDAGGLSPIAVIRLRVLSTTLRSALTTLQVLNIIRNCSSYTTSEGASVRNVCHLLSHADTRQRQKDTHSFRYMMVIGSNASHEGPSKNDLAFLASGRFLELLSYI